MEFLLNRYRNLTVLLVVIVAQLMLIAYQVKTSKDVPLIRVWAVTAVTPIERVLEVVRRNTWGFVEDYFVLLHTRSENDKLRQEIGHLKLENQYLQTELSTADRARALSVFQAHSPSKTLAARIIGNGTGANSKVVFVDRGSGSGVEAGMAVVTPDGIVGKVVAAYPTASLVLLITDGNFAAGVISRKNRVHGTLKGQGHDGTVMVDYVQNEERVDPGEWFYTSGDDRVFPKGFPVGQATAVRNGRTVKEIYVIPSGFQNGLEEVLIVLEGVHQEIPEIDIASAGYKLLQAPPANESKAPDAPPSSALATEGDKLKEQYRQLGVTEKHTFGEGTPGSTPPDFTKLAPSRGSETSGNSAAGSKTPGTAPNSSAETSNRSGTAATPSVAAKPKQASGPLLVTDPADADPSEPATPPPGSKSVKRAPPIDSETEILPPAPAPRNKPKPPPSQ